MTLASGPTMDEIRSWPAAIGVAQASRALGISPSWGFELVARSEFPCRVIKIGRRTKISTSSLVSLLETGIA